MPDPGSGDGTDPRPTLVARAIETLGDLTGSFRGSQPPRSDLLDALSEEEEKVLQRHWPTGGPTGDGNSYYDELMQIRIRRRRWQSRVATVWEWVWLGGKAAGIAAVVLAVGRLIS